VSDPLPTGVCLSEIGQVGNGTLHCERIEGHKGSHSVEVRGITRRWSTADAFRWRTRGGDGLPKHEPGTMVRLPGLVWCSEHLEVHAETVNPYGLVGREDWCHRSNHRLIYYRSRKGDLK
jgi:hypothetical protein